MDEIELKVHDMSSTLQPADAYALVLEEVNGNRKLPIIIGSLEAQAIKVVMMGYKMPRPLTHDLFLTVTKELGTALKKVLIYKVKDGVYYSYLFLEKEGEVFKIDSRTSDAIALAMRCGCPVYTTDEIMESEQLHEVGSTAFSVNVNKGIRDNGDCLAGDAFYYGYSGKSRFNVRGWPRRLSYDDHSN